MLLTFSLSAILIALTFLFEGISRLAGPRFDHPRALAILWLVTGIVLVLALFVRVAVGPFTS